MTQKGQIVEIPSDSALYGRVCPEFLSKEEALIWQSQKIAYSLFDGFLVGGHSGLDHFKLGQRRGINVGGKKQPLYVIQLDQVNHRLFVGAGDDHPGLWVEVLSFAENILQWAPNFTMNPEVLELGVPVEFLSFNDVEKVPALLYVFNGKVYVEFEKPISITFEEAPFSVFYQHNKIADFN